MDANSSHTAPSTPANGDHISNQYHAAQCHTAHTITRMATAINNDRPLHEILRIARDGVLETGLFDRAAIFLYDRMRSLMIGVWGTDRDGSPKDTSHIRYAVPPNAQNPSALVLRGDLDYYLTDDYVGNLETQPTEAMIGVHAHAVLPIRSGGNILGILCVDNLLRNTPIQSSELDLIRPIVDQTAIAIRNVRQQEAVRAANAAMRHSESMRTVGSMATGILHNVRNKLFAIQGYAEMITEAENASTDICHYARIIELASMDATAITNRMRFPTLKTTSTDESDERPVQLGNTTTFDLAHIIHQAVDFTRPLWRENALSRGLKIEIKKELSPNLCTSGVASEIREVLVNLIKNSCEAMPTGGTITISCFEDPAIATNRDANGTPICIMEEMIVITVADTGTGMPEHIRQQIFKPFFTTKEGRYGTGIGLSLAWEIIERHGGGLDVTSEPGKGSCFTIRLPLVRGNTPHLVQPVHSTSLQGYTILLVEDEEPVLAYLVRMLERYGATLHFVQNGEEALDWLAHNGKHCDIIVTEQLVAGSTGLQLLQKVKDLYPTIRRVLLTSWLAAYPAGDDPTAADLHLTKPIRPRQLVAHLAELLGQENTHKQC